MINKTKIHKNIALALLLILTITGCAHMPGGIAASTTPIEGRKYTRRGHASHTDSYILLLGLIPVTGHNSIRDAIDKACRSRRGDAMIEVTVESYSQWWILFTRRATVVEGEVIKFEH